MRAEGAYELISKLVNSTNGEVYLARTVVAPPPTEKFEPLYAVKLPKPEAAWAPGYRETLEREKHSAESFVHPSACKVVEVGMTKTGLPLIAMDHIFGQSLAQVLSRASTVHTPVPSHLILWIAAQIARALYLAHKTPWAQSEQTPILHGSLSPYTVMIDYTGDVKVLGIGTGRSKLCLPPSIGTLAYRAPELIEKTGTDRRADIYSLGVMLYDALSGQKVYKRKTLKETERAVLANQHSSFQDVALDVGPSIVELVTAMMAKRRSDRPQSMSNVLSVLEPALGSDDEEMARSLSALVSSLFAEEMQATGKMLEATAKLRTSQAPSQPQVDLLLEAMELMPAEERTPDIVVPDSIELSDGGGNSEDPLQLDDGIVPAAMTQAAVGDALEMSFNYEDDSNSDMSIAPAFEFLSSAVAQNTGPLPPIKPMAPAPARNELTPTVGLDLVDSLDLDDPIEPIGDDELAELEGLADQLEPDDLTPAPPPPKHARVEPTPLREPLTRLTSREESSPAPASVLASPPPRAATNPSLQSVRSSGTLPPGTRVPTLPTTSAVIAAASPQAPVPVPAPRASGSHSAPPRPTTMPPVAQAPRSPTVPPAAHASASNLRAPSAPAPAAPAKSGGAVPSNWIDVMGPRSISTVDRQQAALGLAGSSGASADSIEDIEIEEPDVAPQPSTSGEWIDIEEADEPVTNIIVRPTAANPKGTPVVQSMHTPAPQKVPDHLPKKVPDHFPPPLHAAAPMGGAPASPARASAPPPMSAKAEVRASAASNNAAMDLIEDVLRMQTGELEVPTLAKSKRTDSGLKAFPPPADLKTPADISKIAMELFKSLSDPEKK